jgi:hypothetical protein
MKADSPFSSIPLAGARAADVVREALVIVGRSNLIPLLQGRSFDEVVQAYIAAAEADAARQLQEEPRRRRRLQATGLGRWYLPAVQPDGERWIEEPLGFGRDGLPAVSERLRWTLKRVPGAPFSIRKSVGPSPEYPGMIRGVSAVVSSTGKVVAQEHFDALDVGQEGPVGFAPNRVKVRVTGAPDAPEMVGREGYLLWSLSARVAGDAPTLSAMQDHRSNDLELPDDARVEIIGPDEDAAAVMAMTMAANSARACLGGGVTAACFDGRSVTGVWPPKPRAKTGIYTQEEVQSGLLSTGSLPEVRAVMAEKGIPQRVFNDWLHDQDTRGERYRPSDLIRLLRDEGDDKGHVKTGPEQTFRWAYTWPARVREFERQRRLDQAIAAAPSLDAAVEAYRRALAEPPTSRSPNKMVLAEKLRQGGYDMHYRTAEEWGYHKEYHDPQLDTLIAGKVTFADLDAAAERGRLSTLEGYRKRAEDQINALDYFAAAMRGASAGVYAHKPTRTRRLADHDLRLSLEDRDGKWRYSIRTLQGHPAPSAYLSGDIPLGDLDEPAVIRKLVTGAERVAQAARTLDRSSQDEMDAVLGAFRAYTTKGDAAVFTRAEDAWPWLHGLDPERVRKAAHLPQAVLDALYAPEQSPAQKQALINHSQQMRTAFAWLKTALMDRHGLPMREVPGAMALFLDWYRGRPFGSTSPDDPAVVRWMRQMFDSMWGAWSTRSTVFQGAPKPWVWGPEPVVGAAAPRSPAPRSPEPPPVAPLAPEPPPLAPGPRPAPQVDEEPPRRAARPERPAAPAVERPALEPLAPRGIRAARAAKTSADVWPPSGKPVVQRLVEVAPTPADFTPDVRDALFATLDPRARGSLVVYLRETASLGRLPPAVLAGL